MADRADDRNGRNMVPSAKTASPRPRQPSAETLLKKNCFISVWILIFMSDVLTPPRSGKSEAPVSKLWKSLARHPRPRQQPGANRQQPGYGPARHSEHPSIPTPIA